MAVQTETNVSIRAPQSIVKEYRKWAKESGRNIVWLVEQAMREYLKERTRA